MRRLTILAGLGLVIGTLSSQTAFAQGNREWEPPQCDPELRTGHFLVNSAVLYLQSATRSRFDDQRERQLADAQRVLRDALNRGQAENAAVWYLWGRYFELVPDFVGADSSYTRAQILEPGCAEDIKTRRHRLWVPIVNAGITAYQEDDAATAISEFRRANTIYADPPQAHFYLADLLGRTMDMPDSAVFYFRAALDRLDPADEQNQSMIDNSTYMVGRYYHIASELDSAVVWYRRYLEINPGDGEIISSLAQVLASLGRDEEAMAVYDQVMANADAMSALDLFDAGVALFVNEQYDRAAQAFELGLAKNPHYRDGIFNLVNTYVAIAQGLDDSLEGDALASARAEYGTLLDPHTMRLIEIDPGNKQALLLRAQSFQLRGEPDSTLGILEAAEAFAVDVAVDRFQRMGEGVYSLHGILTNLGEATVSSPVLNFEFVNEAGEVVLTEQIESQELAGGDLGEFELTPTAEGIAAWRYTVESE